MSDELRRQIEPPQFDDSEDGSGYAWNFSSAAEPWESDSGLRSSPHLVAPPQGEFGPYEIVRELGRGGMGVVFLARDRGASRELALKVILDRNLSDVRKARFQREGQVTAKLAHPGIVRVHTAGEIDGLLFLAYELVEDCRELEDAWKDAERRQRVSWIRDAARALGFAHERGIVHRDVKPANVLVDGAGRVRVTDFGLAAVRGGDRLTQTGAFVGTPTHMAPEQFSTSEETPVGPHTDVWGLGVMLYAALTGTRPFDGGSLLELGANIVEARPTPPRELDPEIPEELQAICLKALSKAPRERYLNADAMAEDLDRALRGEQVSASTATGTGLRRLTRRWPALPMLALTAGVLTVLAGVLLWALRSPPGLQEQIARQEAGIRLRRVDERSARLLTQARPLALDRAALAALDSQVARFDDRPLGAADAKVVVAARDRLRLLQGLLALSSGDPVSARERSSMISDSVLRSGLIGALRAAEGDAKTALRELGLTAEAGCVRADLQAWRALASFRAGERGEDVSRANLEVLAQLERAQDGELPPALRQLQARQNLLLGRVRAARDAALALTDPPLDLQVELRLARAGLELDEGHPGAALALVAQDPGQLDLVPEARARLTQRTRAAATQAFAPAEPDAEPALALLQMLQLLDPGRALPQRWINALIDHVLVVNTRAIELVQGIADLAPDDYGVQLTLARHIVRTENSRVVGPHMDLVRRPVALARTDAERLQAKLNLVVACAEVNRHTEVCALCDELLPSLQGLSRGRMLYLRSNALANLGDNQAALADVDQALKLLPAERSGLNNLRLEILVRLERWDDAWTASADYADHAPTDSAKHPTAVTTHWQLSNQLKRYERLGSVIRRLLSERPTLGGWWVRLAWLQLRSDDAQATAASLQQAAKGLARGRGCLLSPPQRAGLVRAIEALAPEAQRLSRAVATGSEDASRRLDALLERLESHRGTSWSP